MTSYSLGRMGRNILAGLVACVLGCAASAGGSRITGAVIRGHELKLEVVSTPDAMRQGLMFREKLDSGAGMLFVYPTPQPLSFWMKNTRLPLSIAFLDASGVIENIEDMEPFDEKNLHHSAKDAVYAIEVNKGWFKTNGIAPGEKVHFRKTVDSDGPTPGTTR